MPPQELQREHFWKVLHQLTRAGQEISLYFRAAVGTYHGLPLDFLEDSYRHPRLRVTDQAASKAQSLPEPHKTSFMKEYLRSRLFTLSAAAHKYFGPLYRPGRETHSYSPFVDLLMKRSEIEPAFPELARSAGYGEYLKINSAMAAFSRVAAGPAVAEEPAAYGTAPEFPLNQVLYGPPGTGKTFHTVTYAVAIIEHKSLETVAAEERAAVMKRYEKYKEGGQVDFITFHQNYAYEDFVQGLRPDAHAGADTLRFRLVDGVFKKLADRAKANYEAYQQVLRRPRLPFETLLDQMLSERVNRETEEVELPLNPPGGQYKSMIIYEVSEDHLKYKRRTQRNTVREEERLLSLHKLKDKFEGREIREAINKVYYEAVTEALRQFSSSLRLTRDGGQLRNYVLVIDEVNRANVSRVFGELITLLEEDKRLGAPNGLAATLPSGESFAVPPNLYVVGTMNTADKSVALLDVALRRRFAFVPLYPDYSLVPQFEAVLRPLNEKIREKKGTDFLVGHSYFIGKDPAELPGIFNRKIIPLLYEYFQNRPEPVREVLEAAGLTITEENFQWKVV